MKFEKKYYKIGEVSRLLHIHPQTLRLYDRKGILKPRRVSKQRLYSVEDLYFINCIRDLIHKEGFNLNSLSIVLKKMHCWELNKFCNEKKRENCDYFKSNYSNKRKYSGKSS